MTSVSKKSSIDQSELKKLLVSDCKTDYMFRSVTEGFCSPFPKFFKCPTTFDLFLPKWQISNEKIWFFGWKLISLKMSRICRNICLICGYHLSLLLFWWEKFEVSFSSYKISFCLKSSHFDGATVNNFFCNYLTETYTQWNSCLHIRKREAVWFKDLIM